MADASIPQTGQEAIEQGWEPATQGEYDAAVEGLGLHGILTERADIDICQYAPDGTRCEYVPCFNGWEFISTCYNGVCQPAFKRRC